MVKSVRSCNQLCFQVTDIVIFELFQWFVNAYALEKYTTFNIIAWRPKISIWKEKN